jgi:hypothetical protein
LILCMYDEILSKLLWFEQTNNKQTTATATPRATTATTTTATATPRATTSPTTTTTATPRATTAPPTIDEQEHVEEVVEVDTGEKLLHEQQEDSFQFENLSIALTNCIGEINQQKKIITISSFLDACDSICGFILVFGKATSFAASTVNGYIGTISTILETSWSSSSSQPKNCTTSSTFSTFSTSSTSSTSSIKMNTWKNQTIRQVIEREVMLQIANVGGKKKPSCCRCILRLLWFIEFVEACIRYCLLASSKEEEKEKEKDNEEQEEDVSLGAIKAYEETIGSRHSWIIRKGVCGALGAMPKRRQILMALHLVEEKTSSFTKTKIENVQKQMRQLIDQVYDILKEHDLLDIK